MDEKTNATLNRILLAKRDVSETWATLPDDQQDFWRLFFEQFTVNVMGAGGDPRAIQAIGAGLAQIWALAHDYYRLFGPMWK